MFDPSASDIIRGELSMDRLTPSLSPWTMVPNEDLTCGSGIRGDPCRRGNRTIGRREFLVAAAAAVLSAPAPMKAQGSKLPIVGMVAVADGAATGSTTPASARDYANTAISRDARSSSRSAMLTGGSSGFPSWSPNCWVVT